VLADGKIPLLSDGDAHQVEVIVGASDR
jgi:hypothetical protein